MARRSRSRDLAGLAALGALGYTFFGPGRDRPAGAEKAPVEDRDVSGGSRIQGSGGPRLQETFMGIDAPAVAGDQGDAGDFLSRRLRVNPETGEAYSMDNLSPMGAAARRPATTASPPARAPAAVAPASVDESARGRGTNRAAPPPVIGPRSTGRGGATAAEMAAYQRERELERMRGRGYGTTYKKGGMIKAKPKKMASGGMTSASKRADGIATRGKTKCKMY